MTNPIDAIAERLDGGRLWLKGALGQPKRGDQPVCLVGAGRATMTPGRPLVSQLLREVITERYPDRIDVDSVSVLADFNDHDRTTWEDVALVLKDASARWDEAS